METFKQIIYRQEDGALMIIPQNDEIQIVPRFVNELSTEDKTPVENMINFCSTKVEGLCYIVYLAQEGRIDIQPTEGSVVSLPISELEEAENVIINASNSVFEKLLN